MGFDMRAVFADRMADVARVLGIGVVITRAGTDGTVALGWRMYSPRTTSPSPVTPARTQDATRARR
jgi:hypothetical protein